MKKLIFSIILTIIGLFGFIEYKNSNMSKSDTNLYINMRGDK
jgi:hypothetical protein